MARRRKCGYCSIPHQASNGSFRAIPGKRRRMKTYNSDAGPASSALHECVLRVVCGTGDDQRFEIAFGMVDRSRLDPHAIAVAYGDVLTVDHELAGAGKDIIKLVGVFVPVRGSIVDLQARDTRRRPVVFPDKPLAEAAGAPFGFDASSRLLEVPEHLYLPVKQHRAGGAGAASRRRWPARLFPVACLRGAGAPTWRGAPR